MKVVIREKWIFETGRSCSFSLYLDFLLIALAYPLGFSNLVYLCLSVPRYMFSLFLLIPGACFLLLFIY